MLGLIPVCANFFHAAEIRIEVLIQPIRLNNVCGVSIIDGGSCLSRQIGMGDDVRAAA